MKIENTGRRLLNRQFDDGNVSGSAGGQRLGCISASAGELQ